MTPFVVCRPICFRSGLKQTLEFGYYRDTGDIQKTSVSIPVRRHNIAVLLEIAVQIIEPL